MPKLINRIDTLGELMPKRVIPDSSERTKIRSVIQKMAAIANGDGNIIIPMASVPFGLTYLDYHELAHVEMMPQSQIHLHCARLEMSKEQRTFFDSVYDADLPHVNKLQRLRPQPTVLEIFARHASLQFDAAIVPDAQLIEMWSFWFEIDALHWQLVEEARADSLDADGAKNRVAQIAEILDRRCDELLPDYDVAEDRMTEFFTVNRIGVTTI